MDHPAGWLADPTGRFEHRYWDGSRWTDNVSSGGRLQSDPLQSGPPPVAEPAPTAVTEAVANGGGHGSRRTPLLVGLGVAVAAAVAIALFVVLGGDDGGDATSTAPTSGSASAPATGGPGDPVPSGPATTVASDFWMTTPEEVGTRLSSLADASLVGVGYTIDIQSAGRADHVDNVGYRARFDSNARAIPRDARLIPPKGKQFVVVRYDLDTQTSYGTNAPSFSVEVDGVKRSVELQPGVNTLVATIDDDAKRIAIAAQEPEGSQTVSVLTGKRAADVPQVLYRDDRRVAVNDTASLQYLMTGPQNRYAQCGGAGRLDVVVGDAELVWSQRDSRILANQRLEGSFAPPPDGDTAWLVVKINDYTALSPRYCGTNPVIPPERVAVVLPDGEQVTASLATTEYAAFQVPADIESAQLELRPGDNVLDARSPGHIFNFGGAVASVPISFTASGGSSSGSDG
jgi:hypothetical protein